MHCEEKEKHICGIQRSKENDMKYYISFFSKDFVSYTQTQTQTHILCISITTSNY